MGRNTFLTRFFSLPSKFSFYSRPLVVLLSNTQKTLAHSKNARALGHSLTRFARSLVPSFARFFSRSLAFFSFTRGEPRENSTRTQNFSVPLEKHVKNLLFSVLFSQGRQQCSKFESFKTFSYIFTEQSNDSCKILATLHKRNQSKCD